MPGVELHQDLRAAVRKNDRYVIRGQKVWISRADHSDLLLLVVRTTPIEQVKKRTEGLSILLVTWPSTCSDRRGRIDGALALTERSPEH